MMNLVNLTPHPVTVGGVTIPSTGVVRCAEVRERVGTIAVSDDVQVPLMRVSLGQVEGLPEPSPDTVYIVSRLVADACPDRDDLAVPDMIVRDAEGRIIGCDALAQTH
jgi:hypothetical protein